jgi:hypothetical protein
VPHAAATSQRSRIRLLGDDIGTRGLSIRGIAFDTLASVHDVLKDDSAPNFLTIHARITDAVASAFIYGPNATVYADLPDAFARLLLMDDTYEGGNAIHFSTPITDPAGTYLAAARSWRAGKKMIPPHGRRLDEVETFKMQTCTACTGRRFSITQKGYMAMVPRLARVGDVVAVFYGAAVPYVLRKAEGGYLLMGDSYVQGLMGGEALTMMGSGVRTWSWFSTYHNSASESATNFPSVSSSLLSR